jgi:hypothetical protein
VWKETPPPIQKGKRVDALHFRFFFSIRYAALLRGMLDELGEDDLKTYHLSYITTLHSLA